VKAADAGSSPIARGRRGRLRRPPRSGGRRKTAERRGLAGHPRRRRVLLPASTLLHNRPATPQLSLTLGEISGLPRSAPPTPASASTSNRHDHSFRGSSRAAAGGIQLHPMLLLRRRRPSQCSPIQLLPSSPVGGSIGIGDGQAGGADNDYRLDWDWTPDSGSLLALAGLGIWDWGRPEGRNAALGRGGERINHNRRGQSNPLSSISSVSSLLASLSARIFSPSFLAGKIYFRA